MGEKKEPRFKSNSPRFREAFGFAAELHAEQTRKSTDVPYIAHLMGVSSNAIEYGGGEDEAIAALLHDAPEDCGGRPVLEEISARFGDRVAGIVEACTDTFEEPKPEWIERKVRYVAHVKHSTPQARLVSAADKLYNVTAILKDYRTIGEKVFERFKKTKWHVLWYYRSLAGEFLSAEDNELNRGFARTVAELERLVEADSSPEELEVREQVYKELDNEVARSQ
jgi:(p)ppGpp synthase/HD superfamily hydrolase